MPKKRGTAGEKHAPRQASTCPGLPSVLCPSVKWKMHTFCCTPKHSCFTHNQNILTIHTKKTQDWRGRGGNFLVMLCWPFFKIVITEKEKGVYFTQYLLTFLSFLYNTVISLPSLFFYFSHLCKTRQGFLSPILSETDTPQVPASQVYQHRYNCSPVHIFPYEQQEPENTT